MPMRRESRGSHPKIVRDFGPFNAVLSSLRTELAQESAVPIEFLEAFVGNHARTPGVPCGGLS